MIRRIGIPVLFLFVVLVVTSAQAEPRQSAPLPQPQSSATTNPTPFSTSIKKTVGLLRVKFVKENAIWTAEGTCFFVFYEDKRLGENGGFTYLVTNRHVASPGVDEGTPYPVVETSLRLNLRDVSAGSEEGNLPIGGQFHWFFPADDSVDLAVLPLLPDQQRYDFLSIPASIFATHDIVDAKNVTEGDSVLFTGYFYQFPGQRKFQPIIREGILAMMPDEQMETTLRRSGKLYLADLHVFSGNSGSPLLVNLGGLRNGNLGMGYDYRLLGIISGFYHEDANLKLTVATTISGKLEQNSGIAMVVPVDELKTLLDTPAVQAQRDAEIAMRNQAH